VEDFVGAKFYCPHNLGGNNESISITEKKLTCTISITLIETHNKWKE